MIEIRFHGRGGQGAVTAAEILAKAAVLQGKWATSFPAFGPERRGAPVMAFTRVSNAPIRIKSQIYTPDIGVCTIIFICFCVLTCFYGSI